MKMLFVISTMALLMGCASDPYKVCHDPDDKYETETSRNACVQSVWRNEQQKAAYWRQMYMANPQAFQVQTQPVQTPIYQTPQHTQTTCLGGSGYMNCTSR